LKLVFFGSSEFALPSLHAVAVRHELCAVVTQPERPGHRGRPAPRPVADAARWLSVDVLQPERIRDPHEVERVLALRPDALVVAAYGQIVPERLLQGPPHGGVNVHASLLPRWRGAAPVAAAILAGDTRTGVSIMRMDAGLDTGPVYAQREMTIAPDATTVQLSAMLAEAGAALLLEVLESIAAGAAVATPQNEERATHAPRLRRADGEVRWEEHSADEVDRRVRALQPWPGVSAPLRGRAVQLLRGSPARADHGTPGNITGTDGESIVMATRDGGYRIDEVRPPGGRSMTPAAFLRGVRA